MKKPKTRSSASTVRKREGGPHDAPAKSRGRKDESELGTDVLKVLCHVVLSRWADRHGVHIDPDEIANLTLDFDRKDNRRLDRAVRSIAKSAKRQSAPSPMGVDDASRTVSEAMSDTARTIIEAAADCFLYRGDSVSLDEIAKVAGVTKPTIYSYFKGKKELFRAAMLLVAAEMVPKIELPSITGNLREELLRYARASRATLLLERNLLAFRATLMHMKDIPDLGELMGRQSVVRINSALAAFFKQAMDFGSIRPVDPELLSEFFFAATAGQERTRRLSGFEPSTPEREEQYIQQFVDCFLVGVATDPGAAATGAPEMHPVAAKPKGPAKPSKVTR